MRVFLAVLAVSIVSSIVLWNFRLAHHIWPAHPLFATTLIAMICAIATQQMLSEKRSERPDANRK
ncbi:MAG TPA: hypothetical protein VLW06_09035 [Terriglobales bacterium]|nr:hypothetical protein [Terriglobales bacterium]